MCLTEAGAGSAVAAKWSRTQTRTIAEQLRDGIRYFDLRVAPYRISVVFIYYIFFIRSGSKMVDVLYCAVHGVYAVAVKNVLDEIAHFALRHPREIIFIHFYNFFEFDRGHHDALADLISTALPVGSLVPAQRSASAKLSDLRKNNVQIILIKYCIML